MDFIELNKKFNSKKLDTLSIINQSISKQQTELKMHDKVIIIRPDNYNGPILPFFYFKGNKAEIKKINNDMARIALINLNVIRYINIPIYFLIKDEIKNK